MATTLLWELPSRGRTVRSKESAIGRSGISRLDRSLRMAPSSALLRTVRPLEGNAYRKRQRSGRFLVIPVAALRSGVSAIINLRQVLEVQVSVDLGGSQIRVAQQFLYRAQIAGGFQ